MGEEISRETRKLIALQKILLTAMYQRFHTALRDNNFYFGQPLCSVLSCKLKRES